MLPEGVIIIYDISDTQYFCVETKLDSNSIPPGILGVSHDLTTSNNFTCCTRINNQKPIQEYRWVINSTSWLRKLDLGAEDPCSDELQHKSVGIFHLCRLNPNQIWILVQRSYNIHGASSTLAEAVFAWKLEPMRDLSRSNGEHIKRIIWPDRDSILFRYSWRCFWSSSPRPSRWKHSTDEEARAWKAQASWVWSAPRARRGTTCKTTPSSIATAPWTTRPFPAPVGWAARRSRSLEPKNIQPWLANQRERPWDNL